MKTARRAALTLPAAFAAALWAQAPPEAPFRLVPRKAEEPPPAGPAWLPTFDDALAAAKQRHTSLLLYFTAKW